MKKTKKNNKRMQTRQAKRARRRNRTKGTAYKARIAQAHAEAHPPLLSPFQSFVAEHEAVSEIEKRMEERT